MTTSMISNDFEEKKGILCIEHMQKSYKNKQVLRDINLTIHSGELAVITGKSGCGKSTLLNMIGLLDYFDSGKYMLNGISITNKARLRERLRAENIGFVFQAYDLLDQLSVRDNILMPYLYNKKPISAQIRSQLQDYLKLFHIEGLEDTKCKFLSGGEKQRVAIVRAILKNPQLIVADEPTGNLDPENAYQIFQEFAHVAAEGKMVIVVTHNQEVFGNANRHLIMEGGVLHEL